MVTSQVSNTVHNHGTALDEQKKRVRCNYCSKVVSGFSRLKQHLGGVRGDVVPCLEVPEDVKIQMRNSVLERKNNTLSREVVQLFPSEAPLKESSCSNSSKLNHRQHESISTSSTRKRKYAMEHAEETQDIQNAATDTGAELDPMEHAERCIGRFFHENIIDFSAVESPSFQKLISAVVECGSAGHAVPNCNELEGWIFHEETKDIQNYVKEVRRSWGRSGCSILLDGWTDESGRSLINFLVDCPQGPIYLRSADITETLQDVNAIITMLDGVLDEVGAENVVQVITYDTSSFMEAVGKLLIQKHRTIFWTVCASHCICLMVEKIGMHAPFRELISTAKIITEFIYNHRSLLKLVRRHTNGLDLVSSSRIRCVAPFLTLENIVTQEENLKSVFGSSEWKASTWASTDDGRRVASWVKESSFWNEARVVLKATVPLLRALPLIGAGDNGPQMGYIYKTKYQVKETISKEFNEEKAEYNPFWEIIDSTWDSQLHSHLHSAGYLLNPSLFDSIDFYSDAKVTTGLHSCISRMVENLEAQELIYHQLGEYIAAKGSFGDAIAVDQRMKVPPAKWWALYGGQCPELQQLAIRVLSQTCSGGLKYDLKKSLTEKLHGNGIDGIKQQMNKKAYVLHNLQLRHSLSVGRGDENQIVPEGIDTTNDQVVGEQLLFPEEVDVITWMHSDGFYVVGQEPPRFRQ